MANQNLKGLVLSAEDLRSLTDWPEALIEDYLNIFDNLTSILDIIDYLELSLRRPSSKSYDKKINEISLNPYVQPFSVPPDINGLKKMIASGLFQAPSSAGNVTAATNIGDNTLIRGDGGGKGIQECSTITVTDDGEMVNTGQPAFHTYLNAEQSDITGDGTALDITGAFFTERFDQGNDCSNGTFTAPLDGKYAFTVGVYLRDLAAGHTQLSVMLHTSNEVFYLLDCDPSSWVNVTQLLFDSTVICEMDAADTACIRIIVSGGAKDVDAGATFTFISGALLC